MARALASPAARVWAFTALVAGVAFIAWYAVVRDLSQMVPSPFPISWPRDCYRLSALAEIKVLAVHFRRETHAFSLSEVASVIGLFVLSPD